MSHSHRIAVNYFVLGVEKYTENQHEEALELLTVSYIVNDRIGEDPPNMPTPANKMMKLRGLMKHFHLAVESLNTLLVNQFETGDDPGGVGERVARLIVPAIQILQARTHKQPGGRDATILEEVGFGVSQSSCCPSNIETKVKIRQQYPSSNFQFLFAERNLV